MVSISGLIVAKISEPNINALDETTEIKINWSFKNLNNHSNN